MQRIPVGLVGVTGYTGIELVRILANHPTLDLVRVTSRAEAGRKLSSLYPFLQGNALGELVITAPDAAELAAACKLVFLAVPHGAAQEYAMALLDAGAKVVDLSADFRLHDADVFADWYGEHKATHLLPEAVYGLPERYAADIAKARLVANPGCYPTSAILGLWPALTAGLIETDGIIVDSKSGTSGAGRKAALGTSFCEVHDSFRAYNLGKHRHTPEIEQEVSLIAGRQMFVSFSPHLLPIDRGILSTMYAKLTTETDSAEVQSVYESHYDGHPFVRVLPLGVLPETRFVRGTVFCDIGIVVDPRTNRLIVVSAIDNLCRGASGQAVANANLMLGLPLETGLPTMPLLP